MIELTARKAAELAHRVESLAREVERWREATADRGRLEKHWSQVAAVTGEIEVPITALRERIGGLGGAEALEQGARIEGAVADLHRLWDMFRSRLALRYVDHFAPYLLAADELAYRCYQPAERCGAGREPPLVSFADRLSPVTRTRGQEVLDGDPLREALRRLPVALIDLPWSQVEHLPDLPIVAHEVGHDVEADLELGPQLEAALADALRGACERQRAGWTAWRQEAFADVFGTRCLGPAFTSALVDFLAAAPRRIRGEWQADPDWRPHPPSTLRVLLSAAVLESMGFAAEANAYRELWTGAYPSHSMTGFAEHVDAVADALAGPVAALGAFSAEQHAQAVRDAQGLQKNRRVESHDARELIAAARLAFDASPHTFDESGVGRRVLDTIAERQTVGRRSGRRGADPAAVAARAAAGGRWLAGHLADAHDLEPIDSTRETHVQAQQ